MKLRYAVTSNLHLKDYTKLQLIRDLAKSVRQELLKKLDDKTVKNSFNYYWLCYNFFAFFFKAVKRIRYQRKLHLLASVDTQLEF